MKRMNHKLLAVLLALTLSLTLLAGCGGNNNSQNSSGNAASNQRQIPARPETAARRPLHSCSPATVWRCG